MTTARYGIGIDTGGTYTDGALIDLDDHTVLATAKSPTTHFDLSQGIALCLRDLFKDADVKPADIEIVAVSTTLATNAVVESKGDRVGLIVAGYTRPLDLPVVSTLFVEGGHTLQGDEETELDLDAVVRAVSQLKGNVEAYVVCSAMSIKNPAHEKVMAKAVSIIDPLPVFMSCEVSSRVGVADRAATAVLNARLRPVMESFLMGMQDALVALGVARTVMIIRGDATSMNIVDTHRQAASTVASGPAATAWFGLSFAPEKDAVIIDIGGNKTSSMVLDEIKKIGTLGKVKWIIPLGDGELDGRNALSTIKKIQQIEDTSNDNIMFALNRAISMDSDYLEEQFINFFGHRFLSKQASITEVIKDPNYFSVKNDKVITISRYIGSTVWEMANNNIDFEKKVLEAKASDDIELARKLLFYRRIQQEAKDYVINVLNPIFFQLDKWIEVK